MGIFISWQKWLKPGGELLITDYCRGSNELSEAMKVYVAKRHYHLLTPADYGKVRGFPMALFALRKMFFSFAKFLFNRKPFPVRTVFSPTKKFLKCHQISKLHSSTLGNLQVFVRWQNFLFFDSYHLSGHLISRTWPIKVPLIDVSDYTKNFACLRCGQGYKNEKLVITRFSNFCKRKMRYVLDAAYPTSTLACVQPPHPLRRKAEKGPFSVFFFGGEGSAVHRLPPLLSAKIKTVVENAPY